MSVLVPVPKAEALPPPAVRASPGAYLVCWGPTTFEFSPKQRSVVLALLSAREDDGVRWVDQAVLLDAAESDGSRLRDFFKRHPAWGTRIVSAHLIGGPIGSYAIVDPKDD